MLAHALKKLAYDVGAVAGLDVKTSSSNYDVVILDLDDPLLLRQLRTFAARWRHARMIIILNFPCDLSAQIGLRDVSILTKPFLLQELYAALDA